MKTIAKAGLPFVFLVLAWGLRYTAELTRKGYFSQAGTGAEAPYRFSNLYSETPFYVSSEDWHLYFLRSHEFWEQLTMGQAANRFDGRNLPQLFVGLPFAWQGGELLGYGWLLAFYMGIASFLLWKVARKWGLSQPLAGCFIAVYWFTAPINFLRVSTWTLGFPLALVLLSYSIAMLRPEAQNTRRAYGLLGLVAVVLVGMDFWLFLLCSFMVGMLALPQLTKAQTWKVGLAWVAACAVLAISLLGYPSHPDSSFRAGMGLWKASDWVTYPWADFFGESPFDIVFYGISALALVFWRYKQDELAGKALGIGYITIALAAIGVSSLCTVIGKLEVYQSGQHFLRPTRVFWVLWSVYASLQVGAHERQLSRLLSFSALFFGLFISRYLEPKGYSTLSIAGVLGVLPGIVYVLEKGGPFRAYQAQVRSVGTWALLGIAVWVFGPHRLIPAQLDSFQVPQELYNIENHLRAHADGQDSLACMAYSTAFSLAYQTPVKPLLPSGFPLHDMGSNQSLYNKAIALGSFFSIPQARMDSVLKVGIHKMTYDPSPAKQAEIECQDFSYFLFHRNWWRPKGVEMGQPVSATLTPPQWLVIDPLGRKLGAHVPTGYKPVIVGKDYQLYRREE